MGNTIEIQSTEIQKDRICHSLECSDKKSLFNYVAASTLQKSFYSDTRVDRFLLRVFGTGMPIAGAAAVTAGLAATVLGMEIAVLSTIAIGGLCLIPLGLLLHVIADKIFDYNNPAELAEIKAKAKNESIIRITNKHGWKNIFQYQILSAAEVENRLKDFYNANNIMDSLNFHNNVLIGLNQCSEKTRKEYGWRIPNIKKWAHKFYQEIRNQHISTFATHYHFGKLHAYEIISEKHKIDFIYFSNQFKQIKNKKIHEEKRIKSIYSNEKNRLIALEKADLLAVKQSQLTDLEKQHEIAIIKAEYSIVFAQIDSDYKSQQMQIRADYESIIQELNYSFRSYLSEEKLI